MPRHGQVTETAPPPASRQVEYLMIHPEEIGMDLDIARVLDYRQATARLNRYAADGWRVRGFGMFEYAVVLLERDVDPPAE